MRQPEGARPRARSSTEAQRQGAPGRAYPGAAPREVRRLDLILSPLCFLLDWFCVRYDRISVGSCWPFSDPACWFFPDRDKKALEEKAAKKAQQAAAGAAGTSTDNKNKGGGKK